MILRASRWWCPGPDNHQGWGPSRPGRSCRCWQTLLVISLDVDRVTSLPVDQLGLMILNDLIESNESNEYNYLLKASRTYRGTAAEAIAEGMAWLRAKALVARTPGQTSDAAIFVTRTGRRVAAEGPRTFYASERMQGGVARTD